MKPSADFLQAVVRYLSKTKLYEAGHPTLEQALDAVMKALQYAQVESSGAASFSFLGGEVLFNDVPVAELNGWDWAYRFADRDVERIEIGPGVEREEIRRFLEEVARRMERPPSELEELAPVVGDEETAEGREDGEEDVEDDPYPHIRFGPLKLRGERPGTSEDRSGPGGRIELDGEARSVAALHEAAASEGAVRISEALTVVESLTAAMRSAEDIVTPFMELAGSRRYTAAHCMNVSILAMALAEEVGSPSGRVRAVGMAGLLHDLGKARVPAEILDKPGELTDEEWARIRRHPVEGCRILMEGPSRLEVPAVVAFEHHINPEGSGYPDRWFQRETTPETRLVQVCDFYDAVRARRGYKAPYPAGKAASLLEEEIGTKLDPEFARPFLEMIERWDPAEFLAEGPGPDRSADTGTEEGEPAFERPV